jgi:hypothetical protein
MSDGKIPLTLRLDPNLHSILKELKEVYGVSMNHVINMAVLYYCSTDRIVNLNLKTAKQIRDRLMVSQDTTKEIEMIFE